MSQFFSGLIGKRVRQRMMREWTRAADTAASLSPDELQQIATHADRLDKRLTTIQREASAQLMGPRIGSDEIDTPPQCDWSWRPEPWRAVLDPRGLAGVQTASELGQGLKMFHDCPLAEITFAQHRNTAKGVAAPFGVALDVLGFEGSFLSMVFDLPDVGRQTTTRSHIMCLSARLRTELPIEIFARLNVKHGPNTEQLVSELKAENGRVYAEFDLGHAEVNEKRLENIWLDLIFDQPSMNRIVIDDLTLARRPRAEM